MIRTQPFYIKLVKASDWQPFIDKVLGDLDPEEQKLTIAIVSSLHSRHIGITPGLAASLSRIIVTPSLNRDQYPHPWWAVLRRLQQTLFELSNIKESYTRNLDASIARLRLNTSISYTIFRLTAPLVNFACRELGETYLFCEDDHDVTGKLSEKDYRQYSRKLEAEIARLAQDEKDETYQLFWQERAIMLTSLTLHQPSTPMSAGGDASQTHRLIEHRTLPLVAPPELGLFLYLRPRVRQQSDQSQRQVQLHIQQLREWRLPDAGADGVYSTRNAENLHRMLVSERLYPPLMQLDRLINTGYLAVRRPPKPVRLRDVLIVGLFPEINNEPVSGIFVKTCWFEFLMRFSRLLQQSNLNQSELRWIEGDAFHRWRSKSLIVQDLPDIPATLVEEDMQTYRQHFLMKLGWLPAYLDEHAYHEALPPLSSSVSLKHHARVETWLKTTWLTQKENIRWEQRNQNYWSARLLPTERSQTFSHHSWQLDQFAYVHLMVFLPIHLRPDYLLDGDGETKHDGAIARFRILTELKHRGSAGSICVTWVPNPINSNEWHFSGHPQVGRTTICSDGADIEEIAGNLIKTWFDNLVKEMQRA